MVTNMTEQKPKEYSPAERNMIVCMTRERTCTPEKCLKCGWLRKDNKKYLNKLQEEYLRSK